MRAAGPCLAGAGAEEVGVAQGGGAGDAGRVDPVGVLQVGTDVGVGVVDRGGGLDAGDRRDPGTAGFACGRDARWRGGGDVGTERELRVDVCLLVVGGGEDPQVHAEGEQQPEHDQSRG